MARFSSKGNFNYSIWSSSSTLLQHEAENAQQKQMLGSHGLWKIEARSVSATSSPGVPPYSMMVRVALWDYMMVHCSRTLPRRPALLFASVIEAGVRVLKCF